MITISVTSTALLLMVVLQVYCRWETVKAGLVLLSISVAACICYVLAGLGWATMWALPYWLLN